MGAEQHRRRGIDRAAVFETLGHGRPDTEPIDGWLLDPTSRRALAGRLAELATDTGGAIRWMRA
ncbi:MAG: hypothetical protein ACR2JG_15565 [Geodermatophilaceae bacterium]